MANPPPTSYSTPVNNARTTTNTHGHHPLPSSLNIHPIVPPRTAPPSSTSLPPTGPPTPIPLKTPPIRATPTPSATPAPTPPAFKSASTPTPTNSAPHFNFPPAEAGPGPSTQLAQAQAQAHQQQQQDPSLYASPEETAYAAVQRRRKRKWEVAHYSQYEQDIMQARATGLQLSLAIDHDSILHPDPKPKRFSSYEDVVDRLLPYHVWQLHDSELKGSQDPIKERKREHLETVDAVQHIRRLTNLNIRLRKALTHPASQSSDIVSTINIGSELQKEEQARLNQAREVYAPQKTLWDRYQADQQRMKDERARAEERRRQAIEQEKIRQAEMQREKERAAEKAKKDAEARKHAEQQALQALQAKGHAALSRGRGRGRPRGTARGGTAQPAQTHAQVAAAKASHNVAASASALTTSTTAKPVAASTRPASTSNGQIKAAQPSPGRTTRTSAAANSILPIPIPGNITPSQTPSKPRWWKIGSQSLYFAVIDQKNMPQLADAGILTYPEEMPVSTSSAKWPGIWSKATGTPIKSQALLVRLTRSQCSSSQIELVERLAREHLADPQGQAEQRWLNHCAVQMAEATRKKSVDAAVVNKDTEKEADIAQEG